MKVHTEKTIAVSFESWFFLKEEQYRQRSEIGGRSLNRKIWEAWFNRDAIHSGPMMGLKLLRDGDFGGCKGSPINAFEEHRWTSWTLDEMKEMLDKAGLSWKEGQEIESL